METFIDNDGVAPSSLLRLPLANASVCHCENVWLENCPSHFKPVVYIQFFGDMFLLF